MFIFYISYGGIASQARNDTEFFIKKITLLGAHEDHRPKGVVGEPKPPIKTSKVVVWGRPAIKPQVCVWIAKGCTSTRFAAARGVQQKNIIYKKKILSQFTHRTHLCLVQRTYLKRDFFLLRLGSRTDHFIWLERFTLYCDYALWE